MLHHELVSRYNQSTDMYWDITVTGDANNRHREAQQQKKGSHSNLGKLGNQ